MSGRRLYVDKSRTQPGMWICKDRDHGEFGTGETELEAVADCLRKTNS